MVMKETRTARGKMIGMLNEQIGVLEIKDGKKTTRIEVPPGGLILYYTPGDGITEKVFIPPTGSGTTVA
jgi:hypothetical protein